MSPFPPEIPDVERSLRSLRPLLKFNLLALLLTAVLGALVGWIAPEPPASALLFGRLPEARAQRIAAGLARRDIPVHLRHHAGSWRVYVPRERARKLRLETCGEAAAAPGAPAGAWDLIDLDAQQVAHPHESRREATEVELARTLEAMSKVAYARVALPRPGASGVEASASVLLVVREGCSLTGAERDLVRNLVQNSWPGLDASRINLTGEGANEAHPGRIV